MRLLCNHVWIVDHCGSLDCEVNIIFSHVVQVPGLHVLVLQVFTDVAPRTENAVCFLMDLLLLIVILSLRDHIPGEQTFKQLLGGEVSFLGSFRSN